MVTLGLLKVTVELPRILNSNYFYLNYCGGGWLCIKDQLGLIDIATQYIRIIILLHNILITQLA